MKPCHLFILLFTLLAACSLPQTGAPAPAPATAPPLIPPSPAPDPPVRYQSAWGIDYASPQNYLQQGGQTRIPDPALLDDLRQEQAAHPDDPLYMLGRIYRWIQANFETWRAGGATIGQVTSADLLASRQLGGCHDWGLVYISLARELGYPAVMMDSLGLPWADGFQSGRQGPYQGHVFVEVYIDSRWVLVDSANNWYVQDGYDPANPVIPLGDPAGPGGPYGYYVMRKGLDTWDYGIRDVSALNTLMEDTARQLDLTALVYPPYVFQKFH